MFSTLLSCSLRRMCWFCWSGCAVANVGAFREASFSPRLWFNTSSDGLNLCLLYCEEILEFTCTFVQTPSTLSYSFNKPYHGIHTPATVFSLLWSCVFVTVKNVGVKVAFLFSLFITAQIYGDRCLIFTRSVSSGGSRFILMPLSVCARMCTCVWVRECACPRYW